MLSFAVKAFILLSYQRGQYSPNFFGSTLLGESCGSSSGCSVCHGHTEAGWAQPGLVWSCAGPGAPQWPGWGSLRSPRTELPCLALGMSGFFLKWQCWCTAWRAAMWNKCFLKLPAGSEGCTSGMGGAGLSHPYTQLPAVSAPAESSEPRCWSSGNALLDTNIWSCSKCLPSRLPVTADLYWFTAAGWQWKHWC